MKENEYLKDSGVSLVNRYAEIKAAQKLANMQWDTELAKLEDALISFVPPCSWIPAATRVRSAIRKIPAPSGFAVSWWRAKRHSAPFIL